MPQALGAINPDEKAEGGCNAVQVVIALLKNQNERWYLAARFVVGIFRLPRCQKCCYDPLYEGPRPPPWL